MINVHIPVESFVEVESFTAINCTKGSEQFAVPSLTERTIDWIKILKNLNQIK